MYVVLCEEYALCVECMTCACEEYALCVECMTCACEEYHCVLSA